MEKLYSKLFTSGDKDYEIEIQFEGDTLVTGEFIVQPFHKGKPEGKSIRENAMQSIAWAMENDKPLLSDVITVVEYDIRQGKNRKTTRE